MNRFVGLYVLALVLFPALSSAAPDLQQDPISLDLDAANLEDVLRSFAMMTESELDLDPEVKGEVTLRMSKAAWPTALDAICETAGCQWRLNDASPPVLEVRRRTTERAPEGLDAPLRLKLDEVPAADVLTALAVQAGRSIQLEGSFESPMSVTWAGVSVETALDFLCGILACDWSLSQNDTRLVVKPSAVTPPAGRTTPDVSAETRDALRRSLDLSLADAPLEAILQSFGQILEVPVVVEEGVEGSVTVELSKVSMEFALNTICADYGCQWQLVTHGPQARLRFSKAP